MDGINSFLCRPNDNHMADQLDRVRTRVVKIHKLISSDEFEAMLERGVRKKDENGKCIIDEDFVFFLIESGFSAIGRGNNQLLTCKTYDIIQEYDPNVIFMHVYKLDDLQISTAKSKCPEIMPKLPIQQNSIPLFK